MNADRLNRLQKKPLIFLLDFQLILLAFVLAFMLRFDFQIDTKDLKILIMSFPIVFAIKFTSYLTFNLYKILWRYTGVKDLIAIVKSFTFSNLLYGLLFITVLTFGGFPRSVIIIDWFLSIMFLGGIRFFYRIYFKQNHRSKNDKRWIKCLIIGSGDAAELLIREMDSDKHLNYKPVGILDDSELKWNRRLHGIKILGPIKDIYQHADTLDVEEIIVAVPSATDAEMKKIIEYCETCRELGIKYKTIPSINEILSGRLSPSAIRDIKIDDLINRELVITNQLDVRKELTKKIIMVTGACGSIGSELVRQLVNLKPASMILIDRNENNLMYLEKEIQNAVPNINYVSQIVDITDETKLRKIYSEYKPDYLFHAAAYKHVAYMEKGPDEAVKNNVYGTYILAKLADKYSVKKFVMISTDKAVSPTSVMGCTKRLAELSLINMFEESSTSFVIVRFGNVIGSEGSVVPIFQKQIKAGGPLTITDERMKRYFMTIPEAVRLTLHAGHIGDHRDILILDMGEQIKILEIAENLIKLSGYKPYTEIGIKFTGASPGEKMYEELWNRNENPIATNHPKIFKTTNSVNSSYFDKEQFFDIINKSFEHENAETIKELLKKLVPTYQYVADKVKV